MTECEYVPSFYGYMNGQPRIAMACKLCGQLQRPWYPEPRRIDARSVSLALGVPYTVFLRG